MTQGRDVSHDGRPTPPRQPIPLRRPARRPWLAPLALAVAGVVWAAMVLVVTAAVAILAGSYAGGDVEPEDVTAAHHGQLILFGLAVVAASPWVARWMRTRSRLAAGAAAVTAAIPLLALVTHLSVRDWTAAFVF